MRPHIPESIQRQVRQHCGFGCALCGRMPTEIEHIEPYSSVRSHDFENLVLLCRFHHGEVTSKRLGKAAVKEARRYPFSMRENLTTYSPELGKQVSVNFGGINVLSGLGRTFHPFSIAGIKPITISVREKLIVNLNLFDRSGSLVVSVIENVFQFRPSSLWDVKMSGTFLKVSYGLRTTILGVNISDSMIEFSTVRLSANRFPIVADKNGLFFPTRLWTH